MNQFDFDIILQKYLSGEHSPEEEKLVLAYLENNPMDTTPVFEAEKDKIGKRIKSRVFESTIGIPFYIRFMPALKGVAAALIILTCTWIYFNKSDFYTETAIGSSKSPAVVEIKNTSNKPQRVSLEDGSIVILKEKSSISFPEHFGDERRLVYLHGEAFFEVKRNPAKPFVVSTENLVTQVLGTSFTVKSYDDSRSIEVQVKTGRVSVYETADKSSSNSSGNGVILTRNQKITFDKQSKKMELAIVDRPAIMPVPEVANHGFVFSETPLKESLAFLEKAYGIDIVIENDSVEKCLFSGDLTGLPLFDQLDLICKSVNANYERRGTTLFVHGEGCPR